MIITDRGYGRGRYYLKRQSCTKCGAKVIISPSDLWERYNMAYYICPCCKEDSYIVENTPIINAPEAECIKVDVSQLPNREKAIETKGWLIVAGITILAVTAFLIFALTI